MATPKKKKKDADPVADCDQSNNKKTITRSDQLANNQQSEEKDLRLIGIDIKSLIYIIRGQKVMLDSDLAALYGVQTKRLNEAVKRNYKRFEGDDFMFRLTKDEINQVLLRSQIVTSENTDNEEALFYTTRLRSQIATSNIGRGGARYLPYAFTELGVAMLSSVLTSETAININRDIMRAFVAFSHLAINMSSSKVFFCKNRINKLRDISREHWMKMPLSTIESGGPRKLSPPHYQFVSSGQWIAQFRCLYVILIQLEYHKLLVVLGERFPIAAVGTAGITILGKV